MSKNKGASFDNQIVPRNSELQKESEFLKESLKREFGLNQILGRSKVVKELHEKINKISLCDVNVLISGESGTGKEPAARAIHYLSSRAGKPFIPVNCSAIPESLFENELFGHVKGAFTDAGLQQIGLVKESEGGTLFLDEVGVMSPFIQVKLLRLLQGKEYKPLGDPRPRKADIRIIAATNRDLQSLIKEGEFREDLFYRLNIVSLYIPPLRERKEDIPILVKHFVNKYSKEYNKPIQGVSEDAMRAFISYAWQGNIREVENKIQQIIVMSTNSLISSKSVQLALSGLSDPNTKESRFDYLKATKKKVIENFERNYLTQLLIEHRGNVVSAAKKAGKSRTGLWNLIKKYDLSPKQFRS